MALKYIVVPESMRAKQPVIRGERAISPLVKALLAGETVFVPESEATRGHLNGYYEVIARAKKKLTVQKATFQNKPGSILFVKPEKEEENA